MPYFSMKISELTSKIKTGRKSAPRAPLTRSLPLAAALALFIWPAGAWADQAKNGGADFSPSQKAAQEQLSALTPSTFYNELTYNPDPLKAQINLKKPENMDRIKPAVESKEDLVIKRALSLDCQEKLAEKEDAEKPAAASAGDQASPSLMDVPLAPGATLNMGYRYLDYNKLNDTGLQFATDNLPNADYYGKPAEGTDQTAHEISLGVKVELK